MLGYVGSSGVISDNRVEGHGLYTERTGERWRRAPDARIWKRVPTAAIRSTEKLLDAK